MVEEELNHEIPLSELEGLSEDELIEDTSNLLEEDNSEFSREHAKRIHTQMVDMSKIYDEMAVSMDGNMTKITKYLENLQQTDGEIDDVP